MSVEMVEFLKANTWSSFYGSLLRQYESGKSLSPKQQACVQDGMRKAEAKRAAPPIPKTFSRKPGETIEIKAWMAHRLKADLQMEFFFRNLEIVEIEAETKKAYRLKVKFSAQIANSCHFCGRDLDNDISRATGVGPVCATRHGMKRPTLEAAHETLRALEEMCAKVGTVGPFWVAKSQIKGEGCQRNAPSSSEACSGSELIHKTAEILEQMEPTGTWVERVQARYAEAEGFDGEPARPAWFAAKVWRSFTC